MFIWDFVASNVMSELLDWAYGQIVGFLGNFFGIMGNMGVELFELSWVQAVVLFFDRLGWALFAASLIVVCFEFAMEYLSGRGSIHQTCVNLLKGLMAVGLFTAVPVRLYAYSVTLQVRFTNGITGYGSIGDLGRNVIERFTTPEDFAGTALGALLGGSNINIVMMLFCVILMAYAVIAERHGIRTLWASEIEPFPIAVTETRFPGMTICQKEWATLLRPILSSSVLWQAWRSPASLGFPLSVPSACGCHEIDHLKALTYPTYIIAVLFRFVKDFFSP